MALITKPNTFASGTTIISAYVNSNFDTMYNDYNGNITNANIAPGAAIALSKLESGVVSVGTNETITGNKTFSGTSVFSGAVTMSSTVTLTGAVLQGASPLVFEGSTDNAFETTFAITDPTADRIITFPNKTFTLSGLEIKTGSYTGNGSDNRDITIGFSDTSIVPTFVMVKKDGTEEAVWRGADSHSGDKSSYFVASSDTSNLIQAFSANTFQVGTDTDVNASGPTYRWMAIGTA